MTSRPVLLSSQRRAELHWEDFQRGGVSGILCVREFMSPKLPPGMALLTGSLSLSGRSCWPQSNPRPRSRLSSCTSQRVRATDRPDQSCAGLSRPSPRRRYCSFSADCASHPGPVHFPGLGVGMGLSMSHGTPSALVSLLKND